MNNIHFITQLSKEIFNVSQKFTTRLSKAQEGNFRELVRGMVISGSVYLSHIARCNSTLGNTRKDVERLSRTLGTIPTLQFTEVHINSQIPKYRDETVLLLSDGGDLQKPYAQVMEKVCKTVDGSNGHCVGRGYPLQSLVAYGVESKTITPLSMHLYSTEDEDFNSVWDEHKKVFKLCDNLVQSSTKSRIIIEDRGCDDEKRFIYFSKDMECGFVTRINTGTKARKIIVVDEDNNHIERSIQSLALQLRDTAKDERTWINKKIKRELTSRIAYQKVFLPKNLDIPLTAIFVYSEGYKDPLVVLTNLITENTKDAWKNFFYYKKRWEVENFYRSVKQNFSAENFLVLSFKKIQAIAFLLMFVSSIIIGIKDKALTFFGTLWCLVKDFCKQTQRTGEHYLDILAFLREHIPITQNIYSYRFCSINISKHRYNISKNQLKLFDFRKNW